jgi:hypothetical protein
MLPPMAGEFNHVTRRRRRRRRRSSREEKKQKKILSITIVTTCPFVSQIEIWNA